MTETQDIDAQLKEFETLLKEFNGLNLPPRIQHPKTFMDIAGYKETKFSNILAFYLNPEEKEHGLGDLVIRALLECVPESQKYEDYTFKDASVDKEYYTEGGLKIDIVAVYDNLVLGIENKLWSAVHNDLNAYSRELEKIAKDNELDKDAIVKILLAPDKKTDKKVTDAGFESVTYEDLFEKVKVRIGDHVKSKIDDHVPAPSKYITYLIDMFYTLCKPKNKLMEEERYQKFAQFLGEGENLKKLENMVVFYAQLNEASLKDIEYRDKENKFKDLDIIKKISEKAGSELNINQWGWPKRKRRMCYDYGVAYWLTYKDHNVLAEPLRFKFSNWRINVGYANESKKKMDIHQLKEGLKKYDLYQGTESQHFRGRLFDKTEYPIDKFDEANERALQIFLDLLHLIDEKEG